MKSKIKTSLLLGTLIGGTLLLATVYQLSNSTEEYAIKKNGLSSEEAEMLITNFLSGSEKRNFSAEGGTKVSNIIEDWSELDGYDLIWNHEDDYTITEDINLYGDLAEALGILYQGLSNIKKDNQLSIKVSVLDKTIIVD